jgi:cell division septal protein FtsQ
VKNRNPINVGPDQRYWRSRGNRRVRKARRAIQLLRWGLILAVNAIVAAALYLSAAKTVDYLTTTDEFAVNTIDLHGVVRASTEEIDARLGRYVGHNILDLELAQIDAEVQSDPWVRRAAVRRVLPGTLRVRVEERRPAALAIIGDRPHLVDSTGYVIGPTGQAGTVESLPVLSGLDGLDDDTLRSALARGVQMLERLHRTSRDFAVRITELDLSREDRVEVIMADGGPAILLDPDRVDQNIHPFLELRDAIQRRVGSASYIDLRWRDRISVMPAGNTIRRGTRGSQGTMGTQGRGR